MGKLHLYLIGFLFLAILPSCIVGIPYQSRNKEPLVDFPLKRESQPDSVLLVESLTEFNEEEYTEIAYLNFISYKHNQNQVFEELQKRASKIGGDLVWIHDIYFSFALLSMYYEIHATVFIQNKNLDYLLSQISSHEVYLLTDQGPKLAATAFYDPYGRPSDLRLTEGNDSLAIPSLTSEEKRIFHEYISDLSYYHLVEEESFGWRYRIGPQRKVNQRRLYRGERMLKRVQLHFKDQNGSLGPVNRAEVKYNRHPLNRQRYHRNKERDQVFFEYDQEGNLVFQRTIIGNGQIEIHQEYQYQNGLPVGSDIYKLRGREKRRIAFIRYFPFTEFDLEFIQGGFKEPAISSGK